MNNDNVKKFTHIIMEMRERYTSKEAFYGDIFGESLDLCGLSVAAGKMYDKWREFLGLLENEVPLEDKEISETLTDLANYAVMTRMYIENHSQKREDRVDERDSDAEESARINKKYYQEAEE